MLSAGAWDPDGDGDLDIVFADGGGGFFSKTLKMFYNNGGVFNTEEDGDQIKYIIPLTFLPISTWTVIWTWYLLSRSVYSCFL